MENRIVAIRAIVVSEQDNVLHCKLDDGFGNAAVVVHQENAIPA